MRIGAGVQLPLTPPNITSGITVSATPDRSLLLRVAALASSTPWPVIEGPGNPPPTAAAILLREPLLVVATPQLPAGLPTAPDGGLMPLPAAAAPTTAPTPALPAAGLVLPAGSLPPPATAAAFATAVSGPLAATLADRLTLSPTTATLLTENAATAAGKPTVEFTLNLLSALTGEPRSRVQLLAFGSQTPSDPAAVADLAAKGATDLLQLLVRGTVHTEDARQLDMTLGMSLQRQAGAAVLDGKVLDAIRSTLEQLARSEIKLDYPGNAAALAGHSARFQAVLDPLGLWPMQSFVLSGLLILGRAWDEDEIAELDDEETEALSHEPDEGDSHPEQLPRPPKKKSEKALALDEPTPLPEDGGPPIISASHWLELELRHWRSQLRLWMALPAE